MKTIEAICIRCETPQTLSAGAFNKRNRPLCSSCGGIMEPINAPKPIQKKQRKCIKCEKILNSYNMSPYCYACDAKREEEE